MKKKCSAVHSHVDETVECSNEHHLTEDIIKPDVQSPKGLAASTGYERLKACNIMY